MSKEKRVKRNFDKSSPRKILMVSGIDRTIYRFRMELIEALNQDEMYGDIHVACEDTGYLKKIGDCGYETLNLNVSRNNPLSFNNAKSILMLYKYIKQNNISIVHSHTPIGGFIGRISAYLAGADYIIYTTGGFYFTENTSFFKKKMFVTAERILSKITDVIFSVNNEDIETAKSLRILPKKALVYTGGAGVDIHKFDPESDLLKRNGRVLKEKFGIPNDSKVVLFLGRTTKEKGIYTYLDVADSLRDMNSVFFLIVGPKVLDAKLRTYLHDLGLDDKISFTGLREDIPEILTFSDLLLFPSQREGMPVSPLEAMAMEVPVIAHDIRGCREEITNGVNGYLVSLGDIECLRQRTKSLLESNDLRESMGKNGRSFVEHGFSREKVIQRQLDAYKDLFA